VPSKQFTIAPRNDSTGWYWPSKYTLIQFLVILFSLASAVCLVGLLGVRFALSQVPIWEPTKLIPIVGMLLGNAISGVAIGTNHCLTQVVYLHSSNKVDDSSNSSQIEMWLAFGANRWEVGRQLLLKPGLRLAMLPTITQMRYSSLYKVLTIVSLVWYRYQE
jgi:ABC-type iron transport system FetAB permease component